MFMLRYRIPSEEDRAHFQRLMPSIMEPPKFITCPDCGDRYDNDRKRRLIDTCGHPRCYSCLFVDKPCPLCSKIPQGRSPTNSDLHEVHLIDESADKNSPPLKQSGGLIKKPFTGSHPNLSDVQKARSATLPHSGFRTDNYFRSLYRYDPHSSQEYVNSLNVKPRTQGVPNYHKSLENLTEQFWQSVERTGGTRSTSPSNSDDVSSNEGTHLVVPARPRSQTTLCDPKTENRRSLPLRDEAFQRLRVEALESGRSRSHSDLQPIITNDVKDTRAAESRHYERARRDERARSFSPTQFTQSLSDRSSDVSIPFSDSCSESSGDSDHVTPRSPPPLPKRWSYDESHADRRRRHGEFPQAIEAVHREQEIRGKKIIKNPFEGVIYWVVDPPKKTPDVKRPAPHAQEASGSNNERLACADGSENTPSWSSAQFQNPKVTSL